MASTLPESGISTDAGAESSGEQYPAIWQHKYGSEWQLEQEISGMLEGQWQPQTLEHAIALCQERFGCVYHTLSPSLQKDKRVAFVAAVQSSGHELLRCETDPSIREQFDAEFYRAALRAGMPAWVIAHVQREDVRNDPEIVAAIAQSEKDRRSRIRFATKLHDDE